MDLRKALLVERTKSQVIKIVEYIENDQNRFDRLWNLFFDENYEVVRRAGWALSYCIERHPDLISSHYPAVIQALDKPAGDAALRSILRGLQFASIPRELQGRIYDLCYRHLMSLKNPIAVRVFCIQVLFNISCTNSELLEDLTLLLEDFQHYESAAIKARVRNLLQEVSRIKR